jgi:AraC family transcriptional regulator, positive regulator of tynA and feaB
MSTTARWIQSPFASFEFGLWRTKSPLACATGSTEDIGKRDVKNQEPRFLRVHDSDRWREHLRKYFLALEFRADMPIAFESSALVTRFGESVAADLCVSGSQVQRRQRDAENDGRHFFKAFWQLDGSSRIQQGRHQATLNPGEWSIYDTSREYTIESSDRARFLVLLVPQSRCPNWTVPVRELAGSALVEGGAARVALSGLSGLLRDDAPLDSASQAVVQDSTVALIDCALRNELGRRGTEAAAVDGVTLERIQRFILDHLCEAGLTPESVAQAFGIGRRTLYSLFENSDVKPRAFIQHARLERAGALLRTASWRDVAVACVARQCGFADAPNFSRAFHAQYGVSPSFFRISVVDPDTTAGGFANGFEARSGFSR